MSKKSWGNRPFKAVKSWQSFRFDQKCLHLPTTDKIKNPTFVTRETRRPTNSSVGVKGGMCLRNGMWHDLRNDITMCNIEINKLKSVSFLRELVSSTNSVFTRQFCKYSRFSCCGVRTRLSLSVMIIAFEFCCNEKVNH